jgi:hypothetical protein
MAVLIQYSETSAHMAVANFVLFLKSRGMNVDWTEACLLENLCKYALDVDFLKLISIDW